MWPKFDDLKAFETALALAPGLVTLLMVRGLSETHRKFEVFATTLAALCYTFLAHALWGALVLIPWFANWPTLVGLLVCAGCWGVVIGLMRGTRIGGRVRKIFRLTGGAGVVEVWDGAFRLNPGCWVTVHLKDGRSLHAAVVGFPGECEKGHLLLNQVQWCMNEGYEPARTGMLLIPTDQIALIEFSAPP